MNRLLIGIGLVCFAVALIVWIGRGQHGPTAAPSQHKPVGSDTEHAPTKGAQEAANMPQRGAPASVSTATRSLPAPSSTASVAPAIHVPLLAPPTTLRPTVPQLAYAAAHGRPEGFRVQVATSGPAVGMQAMPTTGTAELLYRSNLGGVEVQRWATATWTLLEGDAVQLDDAQTMDDQVAAPLRLALDQGRWRVAGGGSASPEAQAAATEIARAVRMLHGGVGAAASRSPGQRVILGGEPFSVITAQASMLVLAAINDAENRPAFADAYPGTTGLNDAVIWLDPHGRWTAAERLTTAPATPEEPGFLVRRVFVRPR